MNVISGGEEKTVVIDGVLWKVHTFKSSGTLNVVSVDSPVEVLVLGAGGGFSDGQGVNGALGGAGSGGIIIQEVSPVAGNHSVVVGKGAAGRVGENSEVFGLTAFGGGSSLSKNKGANGGSGGGGSQDNGFSFMEGGLGTTGQGFNGGSSAKNTSEGQKAAGGGGGTAQAGQDGVGTVSGNGGNGVQVNFDGELKYYGGGGGAYPNGLGGLGGGGDFNSNGAPNTGGGGGGANFGRTSGGSGIVIVRYKDTQTVKGSVKFKFDVDGVYQELRYYRSTTPMDVSNMPAPIKSGFTEKEITDEAAPDSDFYVRFSAVRSGVEHFSEEVEVTVGGSGSGDPLDEFVTVNVHFDSSGAVDTKGNVWKNLPLGTAPEYVDYGGGRYAISTNGGRSGLMMDGSDKANFGVGEDYCIELLLNISGVFSRDTALFSNNFDIVVNDLSLFYLRSSVTRFRKQGQTYLSFSKPTPMGKLVHLALCRKSGVLSLYMEGLNVKSFDEDSEHDYSSKGLVLWGSNNNNVAISPYGKLLEVRVTKGHYRYDSDFTPPTTFRTETKKNRIHLLTSLISDESTTLMKGVLEGFGYDVSVVPDATFTASMVKSGELIFTHKLGLGSSANNKVKAAFDAGAMVMLGSTNTNGSIGGDLPTTLKLSDALVVGTGGQYNMTIAPDVDGIAARAGLVEGQTYFAGDGGSSYFYLDSSKVSNGFRTLGFHPTANYILFCGVCNKGSTDVAGGQYPARLSMFNPYPPLWGTDMSNLLKSLLTWHFS